MNARTGGRGSCRAAVFDGALARQETRLPVRGQFRGGSAPRPTRGARRDFASPFLPAAVTFRVLARSQYQLCPAARPSNKLIAGVLSRGFELAFSETHSCPTSHADRFSSTR